MAPATCLSQLIVLVVAAPFASTAHIAGKGRSAARLLGIGQIGLGLILLTIGARQIPAAEVGLDHAARDRARPVVGLDLPRRAAARQRSSAA
jgi:hypothetical protein